MEVCVVVLTMNAHLQTSLMSSYHNGVSVRTLAISTPPVLGTIILCLRVYLQPVKPLWQGYTVDYRTATAYDARH